ncbi:unnamed protein product [Durusdinium trenchii]|uniref:Uncharacterized protein n=2 Tax=Durusdinium trenchii TaxID=1381693 RepID=A0ABP0J4C8_9DINO
MCEEPFDCLNATGTLESLEDLQHGIAKPSGTNLQSWCYSEARSIEAVVPHCLLRHDPLATAKALFAKSVELHPLDDIDVTLNTTIPEAEAMCDARYPEPNGWRSVGFSAIPAGPKDHFTRVEDAEKYVLFACAMGNYHGDVIYCRESYCHNQYYKEKFQHLAPK